MTSPASETSPKESLSSSTSFNNKTISFKSHKTRDGRTAGKTLHVNLHARPFTAQHPHLKPIIKPEKVVNPGMIKRRFNPDTPWKTVDVGKWPDKPEIEKTIDDMQFVNDPYFIKSWPDGSIFQEWDPAIVEAGRLRRANKICKNTSYFELCKKYGDLQKNRATKLPNEYELLLKRNAKAAADADRAARILRAQNMFLNALMGAKRVNFQAWAGYLVRVKRVRAMFAGRMASTLRISYMAWSLYVRQMKSVRKMLGKRLGDRLTLAFRGWSGYIRKLKRLKKLMRSSLAKLEQRIFKTWRDNAQRNKYIKDKMLKQLVGAKREKLLRWRKYTVTSMKMKRLMAKFFAGAKRNNFMAWKDYTKKSRRAAEIMKKVFMGLSRRVFTEWREVCKLWKKERLDKDMWNSGKKPNDFFSINDWGIPPHSNVGSLPVSYKPVSSKFRAF